MLLVKLKDLRNRELLERYMDLYKDFQVFTHAVDKLFGYLNRYYLVNQQARFIADESM